MRFMMFVKADAQSEAGVMPDQKLLSDMMKFNEDLAKAGAMLDGSGLHPSSKGARVTFSGGKPRVTDGPFTETKELVSGYWLIQAKSREEAIEWARRVPFVDGQIEIRPLFELEDFEPGEAIERARELEKKLKNR